MSALGQSRHFGAGSDFRFASHSDRIAALAAKVSKCFESSLLRLGLPHSRCPQSRRSLASRLNITLQPRLHLPIQPRPIPLATRTFNLETARPDKDCLQVRTMLPARTAWAPAKSLAVGISRRNTLGTGAAARRLGCNRAPQACAICAFRTDTFALRQLTVANVRFGSILFSNSGSGCQALHDHPCRAHCSLRGRGKPSA